MRFEPPQLDVAARARSPGASGSTSAPRRCARKLDALGIGGDMVGLVEEELNREGLTMGVLAHPPKLTTFATMRTSSKAA